MKRLLVASSVCALALGGAALAQNSMNGSQSQMQSTAPRTAAGANSPSNKSSADMSGRAQSSQNLSSTQVRQAQTALKQQGLYNGQIDGKFGPQTRAAVSQFQKKNGLPQTAALNEQTLNDLNRSDSSGSSLGGVAPNDNSGPSSGATPSTGPANAGGAAPGNSMAPGMAAPNSNNAAQSR